MPRIDQKRRRRLRWFQRGFALLEHRFPEQVAGLSVRPVYMCPICTKLMTKVALDSGHLTEEHVPPASLGGRPLVLTCTVCNSTAGTAIDSHAYRKENIRAFLSGATLPKRRVRLAIGDTRVNAELHKEDRTTVIRIPKETNHPSAPQAFAVAFGGTSPFNVTLVEDVYRERAAKVSWLKSAYLVMFALFGYDVVVAPSMALVRKQIMNPDAEILDCFMLIRPGAVDLSERKVMKVSEPDWLKCWAVTFGANVVLLPEPKDVDLYKRISERIGTRGTGALIGESLTGTRCAWPIEPWTAVEPVEKGKNGKHDG